MLEAEQRPEQETMANDLQLATVIRVQAKGSFRFGKVGGAHGGRGRL
jgi:hypothetical protein